MTTREPDAPGWTIIVPVKQTMYAKTRLTGYPAEIRRNLAVAFAVDTVTAALACDEVDAVVVVTSDVSSPRFAALGATIVADRPDAGLNPALLHAAHEIRGTRPSTPVAAISSDLPALRASDLSVAIRAATTERWFVADAHGVGTTMLAAGGTAAWSPQFGPHSRAAHRLAGFEEVEVAGIERLRRDVDTPVDLWDATRLGLGAATLAVLDSISEPPPLP